MKAETQFGPIAGNRNVRDFNAMASAGSLSETLEALPASFHCPQPD